MPAVSSILIGTLVAGSLVESRNARKDSAKARKVQEKSNQLQAGKQAVEQVRQAQIARASITQQGENQNVGGSSAIAGAVGSTTSQAGSNIGFAQQLFSLQQSTRRLQDSAEMHSANASGFAQLATVASSTKGSEFVDGMFT